MSNTESTTEFCTSCDEEFPKSELHEGGDPWGLGPRYYSCEACNDAAVDRYLDNLYS